MQVSSAAAERRMSWQSLRAQVSLAGRTGQGGLSEVCWVGPSFIARLALPCLALPALPTVSGSDRLEFLQGRAVGSAPHPVWRVLALPRTAARRVVWCG